MSNQHATNATTSEQARNGRPLNANALTAEQRQTIAALFADADAGELLRAVAHQCLRSIPDYATALETSTAVSKAAAQMQAQAQAPCTCKSDWRIYHPKCS